MFKPDAQAKAWLDEIAARANSAQAVPSSVKDARDKTISPTKRAASFMRTGGKSWQQLAGEDKAMMGMNFLFAGLMAASAFNHFRHGVAKDEEGNSHIQPTQVGLGIVMGMLAAGSAYLGAKPLMAVAR